MAIPPDPASARWGDAEAEVGQEASDRGIATPVCALVRNDRWTEGRSRGRVPLDGGIATPVLRHWFAMTGGRRGGWTEGFPTAPARFGMLSGMFPDQKPNKQRRHYKTKQKETQKQRCHCEEAKPTWQSPPIPQAPGGATQRRRSGRKRLTGGLPHQCAHWFAMTGGRRAEVGGESRCTGGLPHQCCGTGSQ